MIWLRHPDYLVEYCSARLVLALAQSLPLPTAVRLGEWAGRRMIFWTRRNFETAVENILHAYPAMSRAEAVAMTRRVYEHFGRSAVEIAFAHRLLKQSTYRDHVVVRNEHRLREAKSSEKGAIFVTAHLGLWELLGIMARHWDIPLTTVYRPVKNPYIERLVGQYRGDSGQNMVTKYGVVHALLRILREGGYIALLVDQHTRGQGIWVPFFGRPASTTPTPAFLALKSGAPIYMLYARRLPGLYRFEVFCDEPMTVRPTGDRRADLRRVTEEITRRVEGYVRQFPEQWLWLHRRWRTPPPEAVGKEEPHVGSLGAAG